MSGDTRQLRSAYDAPAVRTPAGYIRQSMTAETLAAWKSLHASEQASLTDCRCGGLLAEDDHGRIYCLTCERETS